MKTSKMQVVYTSSSNRGIAVAKGMTAEKCRSTYKGSFGESLKCLPLIGFIFG